MTDAPPPESPEDEHGFSEVFRGLRERVFHGSSELAARVMRGVEQHLETQPTESLLGSMLVQLTNVVTGWFDPEAPPQIHAEPRGPQTPPEPPSRTAASTPPTTRPDEAPASPRKGDA